MKRIVGVVLVMVAVSCGAQVTPNISLNLPNYASPNWNVPLNQNFTILDNYLGGVNNFPNPLHASITGSAVNLAGGALGSVPYQNISGITLFVAPNTTTTTTYLCETGTGMVGAAPSWCTVSGVGTVTSFVAPSVSWPTWLVPTVTNATSTPSLTVSASAIPNAALANAATTVNGTTCTLGSTCTPPAPAGTLTGSTLASGVTGSSLTSVGTIGTGVWQGTPVTNTYLANPYTTVNGQLCTLGSSCTVTAGSSTNLSGGTLGSVPYQSTANTTQMLAPNTTTNTLYLCQTGTGSVGAAPAWCAGNAGTVTSVALSVPSQLSISGSPITTSGTLALTLNSPTGSGAIVLATSPTLVTPALGTPASGVITNLTGTCTSCSVGSNAGYQISFQPGPLTSITNTPTGFFKVAKASTVDNIVASALLLSCVANPTISFFECSTSATCAVPTTIGTVSVSTTGTATVGSISSASITAGDYVAWAITTGTCTSLDVSVTSLVHSN